MPRGWRHCRRAIADGASRNCGWQRCDPARAVVDRKSASGNSICRGRRFAGVANWLIAIAVVFTATAAHADPIVTPIVTAILGELASTALFTTGAYTLTVGAAVSSLVTTALGLVLTLLLTPRPKTPTPDNGAMTVQQTLPYRVFAVGRTRLAGAIMLKEEFSSYLMQVNALAGHYCDGFEHIMLNDDLVSVPTVGLRLQGAVAVMAGGRYGGSYINIDTRQGIDTETAYGNIAGVAPLIWTAAHRGDNIASMSMLCAPVVAKFWSTIFPYGAPQPSAILRGAIVYDPRDPSQNPADRSTWKWSKNTALIILWYLCFSDFGFRSNYETSIVPFMDFWLRAFADCEDAVAKKTGGTEPRYEVGGWSTAEQTRITNLAMMLQCCDGFLSRRGRGYVLIVGKFYEPTVIVTDDQIAGFTIQSNVSTEDKVNEGVARYTSPDNGYMAVDTDPVIDAVDQRARGGAPRKAQLEITWVQSTGQASRLLKREMIRQRTETRGSLVLYWSGMNAAFERYVRVQSNNVPRLPNTVIEVRKAVIHAKSRTVSIDWILSGPEIDAYDPAIDESSPPFIPVRPDSIVYPVVTGVSILGSLISDSYGSVTVVLLASFDQPLRNGIAWQLNYTVHYRLTDDGSGSPGPWVEQTFAAVTGVSGRVTLQTSPVPAGTSLDVEISTDGGISWSPTATVSTNLGNLSPLPPVWTSAVGASGAATLTVVAPVSANFYGVQFYRAVHGGTFGSASSIGAVQTGAPSATISYVDTHTAGTFDYFAVAQTNVPVSSSPVGPRVATIT